MVDIRQTPQYADYLSKIGWKVEQVKGVNYFIRTIPIFGSIIKIQRPEQLDISTARQLGKRHRAFQIIIEPKNSNQVLRIMNYGFKQTKSPFLPSKTLCLDLTMSKEKLFAGFKKDCRAALRQARNLRTKEVKNQKEIKEFREAWKKSVGMKRYVPPLNHLAALKESFGDNCLFLSGKQSNSSNRYTVASGAIFLLADGTGYYWQAFTNNDGRKLKTQYKILWEGILWAKKRGAKVFDFEGIYDPRFPNKSWLGFTHFKKSFGGYEVEYPGAFVKNLLPFKLWI